MSVPSAVSGGVEVELKLLLDDEEAWSQLSNALSRHCAATHLHQHNHYLDTAEGHLHRAGIMVRVRLEGNRATATCKAKSRLVDGLMQVGEWEAALDLGAAARWRQPTCWTGHLNELPIASNVRALLGDRRANPKLEVHAIMHNHRQCWAIDGGALGWPIQLTGPAPISLELDRATLPGGSYRFELEVEHANAAALAHHVRAMLTALDLNFTSATESKYAQVLRLDADVKSSLTR